MRDLVFAVPGDLDTPTGGYEYARRLLAHLPAAGVRPRVLALPAGYPSPTAADLRETAIAFAAVPPGVPLLVDGLAFGAMPPDVVASASSRAVVALVHHPLGLEEGLSPDRSAALLDSERRALAMATRVIVTSPYTARLLGERLGVPGERIDVARPGTEKVSSASPETSCSGGRSLTDNRKHHERHAEEHPEGASRSTHNRRASFETAASRLPQDDDVVSLHAHSLGRVDPAADGAVSLPLRLLAVGAVVPRKGYPLLIQALRPLASLPWQLVIVGALDRAPDHAEGLRRQIKSARLDNRVVLAGAVSAADLARHFAGADALVSASVFEGYGMTLADALARGLPIVMARAGAADETVPDDAALKVPPGDAPALSAALRRLLAEPETRLRLAGAAREAGLALLGWADTAAIVAGSVAKAVEAGA